jgi:hypothetical protein
MQMDRNDKLQDNPNIEENPSSRPKQAIPAYTGYRPGPAAC